MKKRRWVVAVLLVAAMAMTMFSGCGKKYQALDTQQSGEIIDLKIANLAEDNQIVQLAQQAAVALLTADPTLAEPQHQPLRQLKARYAKQEDVDFSVIL